MTSQLITKNLNLITDNLVAGFGGIITYPTIQIITGYPIGFYALFCYSIHHVHIMACLQNITTLTKRHTNISSDMKYINYDPFTFNYTFNKSRTSLYSTNIQKLNNFEKYNLWYAPSIQSSTFSNDAQLAINEIVYCRDITTRCVIGMNIVTLCGFILQNMSLEFPMCFIPGIFCSTCYIIVSKRNFTEQFNSIKKEISSDKKYFYINTFGNIVPTNFKFGLYHRHFINKN